MKVQAQIKGAFALHKLVNGKKVPVDARLPSEIENLVLDQYITDLNNMNTTNSTPYTAAGRGLMLDGVAVGSGAATPSYSDTALESEVARTTTVSNEFNDTEYDNTSEILTITNRADFIFNVGAVVGNISELGALYGSSNEKLMTRALVKDSQGVPTTISVASDEQLVITYTIITTAPAIVRTTLDIAGISTEVSLSIRMNVDMKSDSSRTGPRMLSVASYLDSNGNSARSYLAEFGSGYAMPPIFSDTSGALTTTGWEYLGGQDSGNDLVIKDITPLNPATQSNKLRLRLGLATGNYANGIGALSWSPTVAPYQGYRDIRIFMEFSEPVIKTENDFFEIEVYTQYTNQ